MDGWNVIFRHVVVPCGVLCLIVGSFWLLLVRYPLIFVGVIALLALGAFINRGKAERSFRKKGYRAGHEGRDNIYYQEQVGEHIRKLTIEGEMMIDAPHVIYVPSGNKWKQQMPEWAQGRRAEILHRIEEELGTTECEFVEN
jgi:hypothetical protein